MVEILFESFVLSRRETYLISDVGAVSILSRFSASFNTPILYKRPLFGYGIWARIRGERTLPAICLQQYNVCDAEFSIRNLPKVSQFFKFYYLCVI